MNLVASCRGGGLAVRQIPLLLCEAAIYFFSMRFMVKLESPAMFRNYFTNPRKHATSALCYQLILMLQNRLLLMKWFCFIVAAAF